MPKLRAILAFFLLCLIGCGIGTGNPLGSQDSSPMPPPDMSPIPQVILITSEGVNPPEITFTSGVTITFRNNDSLPHQIASDPHPEHSDCPELNGPILEAGESFVATFTGQAKTCTYHDEIDPLDVRFQGVIQIQ